MAAIGILGGTFDMPALLAEAAGDQDMLEYVVAAALIAVDTLKLDTPAARELLAGAERRRAEDAAAVH